MILDFDDLIEYEVVSMDGESTYFEDKEDALAFFNDEDNNALILNRVATEALETKGTKDGS